MPKRQVIVLFVLSCIFQGFADEATRRHHARKLRRNGNIGDEERRRRSSKPKLLGSADDYEYDDSPSSTSEKKKPGKDPKRPCNSKFLYGCSERSEHGKSGKGPDRPCYSKHGNNDDSCHHDGHQSNGERPNHGKSGKGTHRPCNSKFLYGCNHRADSWHQNKSYDENDKINAGYHHNGQESDVPSLSHHANYHCHGLRCK
ncbi:hypothetical protein ACHAWX_006508 [Stephanocyclus meneghinianus]